MWRRILVLIGFIGLLAASSAAQGAVHTVRSGETVFGIVTRTYGCPSSAVEQVARDNRLVNYRIFPGQALLINCTSAVSVTSADGSTTTSTYTGVASDFGIIPPSIAAQGGTITIIVQPNGSISTTISPDLALGTPSPTTTTATQGLSLADLQALLAQRGFSPTSPVWCDSPSVLSDPARPQLRPEYFDPIPTVICPPGLVAIVAKSRDTYSFILGQPAP